MTSRPIRVAVIGTGQWGKNILNTLDKLPECTVVYTRTRDHKDLLAKNDIDAVVIATPGSTHAEVALPFIQKGIPIFIEKPLTTALKDARRLVIASAKNDTLVFVGHIHLYSPAYLVAKEAVKNIGKIKVIIGEGVSNGPFREDISAMWDWAPHDIAMTLDMTRTMPTSVQAWGISVTEPRTIHQDITYTKLNFTSGLVAIISSSRLSSEKRRKMTIIGTRSSVVYDDTVEKKVTLYKGNGAIITKDLVSANQTIISYPTYPTDLALTEEMKAFLSMVRTKKKPKTDLQSGLNVVAILEAAEKSIKANGKMIRIKI